MNNCGKCGGEALVLRRAATFSHEVSGIVVELKDSVCEVVCAECGVVGTLIQNHEGLVAAVAVARSHIPVKLNGIELRFMRKALGMTAAKLAARLDVSAEHLSRWERGHLPITSSKERSLRMLVVIEMQDRAPAIDSDFKALCDMEISPIRNGLDDKPMRFELVRFKERDTRQKQDQWDTVEPRAHMPSKHLGDVPAL